MSAEVRAFQSRIDADIRIEPKDWMPDAYRKTLIRQISQHAHSEIVGMLPEGNWITRAPSLKRKAILMAKVQDEGGHGLYLYSAAETLGVSRDRMVEDLHAGRAKYSSIFNYPTLTWADVGAIGWLVDGAAIMNQVPICRCSYAPYARTMKKICWEESVHIMHGRDVVLTLMTGTESQRAMVQEALDRWWGPLMQMHGPPTDPAKDKDLIWQIKSKGNEQLRQEFLGIYVPRIWELGLTVPDPALAYDNATGRWQYTEPDWDELRSVVTGHGPMSQERLAFRRLHRDETQWVRDAVLGVAA